MELSDKSSRGKVIASGLIPFVFVLLMMALYFWAWCRLVRVWSSFT